MEEMNNENNKSNILCLGMVVVILAGRHAGKKAFIVKKDDVNRRVSVVGIDRSPKRISNKKDDDKSHRNSHIPVFIKSMNYSHIFPTRFGFNLDLKNIVSELNLSDVSYKNQLKHALSMKLKAKYNSGDNSWLFQKLYF